MRARPPPWVALLLALALLGQSALAAAHCLRLAASATAPFPFEICTADGLVPAGHGEAPDAPAADGFCPACPALPQLALPGAPTLPDPAWAPAAPPPVARADILPPGARAPPYHPRGPPSFS
jgi:hypothetical protein